MTRSHPVRALPWLFFVLLVVTPAPGQQAPPPEDTYRYRVNVGLVLVAASVTTADGLPVTDLGEAAFQVYEDGLLRPVKVFEKKTALPLQLVLMVDASLSAASELDREKLAMTRFIQRVLRPQDAAALYEFSGGARARVDFSNEPKKLEAGLALIKPRAGTALYDAVVEASEKLKAREGRRVLVLVTDGTDTSTKDLPRRPARRPGSRSDHLRAHHAAHPRRKRPQRARRARPHQLRRHDRRPRLFPRARGGARRSEERRVGKECRSRWSPDH